jgi:hypothetical protein
VRHHHFHTGGRRAFHAPRGYCPPPGHW